MADASSNVMSEFGTNPQLLISGRMVIRVFRTSLVWTPQRRLAPSPDTSQRSSRRTKKSSAWFTQSSRCEVCTARRISRKKRRKRQETNWTTCRVRTQNLRVSQRRWHRLKFCESSHHKFSVFSVDHKVVSWRVTCEVALSVFRPLKK